MLRPKRQFVNMYILFPDMHPAFDNYLDFFLKLITGRKVAIDASMSIYQFLIAVRQDGSQLMNEEGETTR